MTARWQTLGSLLGVGAPFLLALACGQADDFDASGALAPGTGGGSADSGGFPPTEIDGSPDGHVDEPPEAGADLYAGSRFQAVPVTYLVHAAPELYDFRVCVKSGESFVNDLPFPSEPDHFLPASNYPGVPRGGVVEFDESLLGTQEPVTLYLVQADDPLVQQVQPALNPQYGCETIITELYSVAVSFERSALSDHTVRAIVIDKNGNGAAKVIGFSPEIDMEPSTTKVSASHSSPVLKALQDEGNTFELSYGKLKEGESREVIAANLAFDRPPTATQDFTPPSSLEFFSDFGFVITQSHDNTPLVRLKASLADVQRISSPYETPQEFYAQNNGLLLLALGDVDDPADAQHDGKGLHLLALRFNFQQADP